MIIVDYVCSKCEGADLTFSFDARWNVSKQWMDYEPQPYVVFCHDCDDETFAREVTRDEP